jgi:pimeloyl-ACP methyl ester carboxylesterase
MMDSPEMRRAWRPRMAAHGTPTLRGYLRALLEFTLEDRVADITCPTLVTEGERDFAGGQAKKLYDLLECPKQYRFFTEAEGASGHMEGLGQQLWNGYVFDWLGSLEI